MLCLQLETLCRTKVFLPLQCGLVGLAVKKLRYVTLGTGTEVSRTQGAPNPVDMAWALCRVCRYAGNLTEWWPVGLHSFVVADLLPPYLKIYGLLHDGPECVGNDVPKPVKLAATSRMEDAVFTRMCRALGLRLPTAAEHKLIKAADILTLHGEVWNWGLPKHRARYPERNMAVEELVLHYHNTYPVAACVDRQGTAPAEFLRRYHEYRVYNGLYGALVDDDSVESGRLLKRLMTVVELPASR